MLVTLRNQRVKRQCCIIALVSILEFGSMINRLMPEREKYIYSVSKSI